ELRAADRAVRTDAGEYLGLLDPERGRGSLNRGQVNPAHAEGNTGGRGPRELEEVASREAHACTPLCRWALDLDVPHGQSSGLAIPSQTLLNTMIRATPGWPSSMRTMSPAFRASTGASIPSSVTTTVCSWQERSEQVSPLTRRRPLSRSTSTTMTRLC